MSVRVDCEKIANKCGLTVIGQRQRAGLNMEVRVFVGRGKTWNSPNAIFIGSGAGRDWDCAKMFLSGYEAALDNFKLDGSWS